MSILQLSDECLHFFNVGKKEKLTSAMVSMLQMTQKSTVTGWISPSWNCDWTRAWQARPSVDQTSKTQCLISPQISCWRSWRPDLVQSDLYSWSPVRKVTGEERAHAQNKSSKLQRFFYVLKQQIWWCLEVFSKKPGYTCIHLNYEPTNLLLFFFFATLNSTQQLKMDPF